MMHVYHIVVTTYGFWLPNDPRGSWSSVVREWELSRFGRATKTDTRRSVAARAHDQATQCAAKQALRYPPVQLDGQQALLAAQGISGAASEAEYEVLAFAILPEHWHIVIARHAKPVDTIVAHLKAKATMAMSAAGRHPMASHPRKNASLPSPWARRHWTVFIDGSRQLDVAVDYVRRNPAKEGLPVQAWSFVRPEAGAAKPRRQMGRHGRTGRASSRLVTTI